MTATLSASLKRGTIVMDRKQIAKLPVPKSTQTFKAVPHLQLIETLESVLVENKIKIQEETFGVGKKGKTIFGVMKLNYSLEHKDGIAALGFRQANNKTMSIQICAGFSVFVCDNLVFRGDLIALKRRHTSGLDLVSEVREGIEKFKNHLGSLETEIKELKEKKITDTFAKETIHDVFAAKMLPVNFMPQVSHDYFTPPHQEFESRTMWSLHNAFTESIKRMPMTTKFFATQRIGKYFGLTSK